MKSPGRNDPCPCGSGERYKHCCGSTPSAGHMPSVQAAGPGARGEEEARADIPGLLMQAVASHQSGRLQEAVAGYRNVLALDPGSAEVHNNLGLALQGLGRLDEASACYRRALSMKPDFAGAHANLGTLLQGQGDLEGAAACYREAISFKPDLADAYYNLGAVFRKQGKPQAAIDCYRSALQYKPDNFPAYFNLGNALIELGDLDEAARCYREVISRRPDFAEAYSNLGNVFKDQGRLDEAVDNYRRAILLKPDNADAHHHLGLVLLLMGDFAEGWREHEWRITFWFGSTYIADPRDPSRTLPRPSTRLPFEPAGKRILLVPEQGIGDELFFLSFARVAQQRGAWTAYSPSAKIATLVQRAPGLDTVCSGADIPPDLDYIISVGDLPLILGVDRQEDIPPSLPLTALPDRVAAISDRLAVFGNAPLLGVSWRAGAEKVPGGPATLFRETDITLLGHALAQWPGEVLILQRNPRPQEMERFVLALGRPAHDFSACNDDLEDMLALLSQLDDYVGVSNTNMHLMAGLGKPARVLVTYPPEWRWMMEGDESPWYRGFRIYREAPDGNWNAAFSRLTAEINSAGMLPALKF